MFQLAAGLSLSDVVDGAKDVFESIANEAQKALESLQDQSESSLNQIAEEVNSQLEKVLPELEEQLSGEYSGVVDAVPKIKECLEAQRDRVEKVVEDASTYANTTQYKPIEYTCCQ